MAQRLEDALLAESDDDETDPVESFLASLQNLPDNRPQGDPVINDSPSRDQSVEDRIEAFVQKLRQIRNVNLSDMESQPPAPQMPEGENKDSLGTTAGKAVDPSSPQESKVESLERSKERQPERPSESIPSPASPFYYANSTFYFANMTYGDAAEFDPPEVTERKKQELKKMEDNMLVYLEKTRPAVERTVQFAKDFAATASPIVQKGASSLGSAWIGLYSAAKTVAEQKWMEQAKYQISSESQKKQAKDSDPPRANPWRAVQSVLENMFVSIESGQLNLPFGQKNTVGIPSSDFKPDINPKDEASEKMILSDSTSEIDKDEGGSGGELTSVGRKSETAGTPETRPNDFAEGSGPISNEPSDIGAQSSRPSMQELAMSWVQMNRDTKGGANSNEKSQSSTFSIAWSPVENEVAAVLDGVRIKNESEEAGTNGLEVQDNASIRTLDEDDSSESLRSDDRDRIEALKRKLGQSPKDETEHPLERDPKMLEDALADIRMKLASRDDIGAVPVIMSNGDSIPSRVSTVAFPDGNSEMESTATRSSVAVRNAWPNYTAFGSGFAAQNEGTRTTTSKESKSPGMPLSNDLSSHWVDLANEWKERNNEMWERAPSSISFDSDQVSSDNVGVVANENRYEELAKEWKERNSGE